GLPADDAVVPAAARSPDGTPAPDPTLPLDAILPGAHRRRACVVAMGGRTLAVDVRETREVMKLDVIGTVPGAPAPLLGVANLRGTRDRRAGAGAAGGGGRPAGAQPRGAGRAPPPPAAPAAAPPAAAGAGGARAAAPGVAARGGHGRKGAAAQGEA